MRQIRRRIGWWIAGVRAPTVETMTIIGMLVRDAEWHRTYADILAAQLAGYAAAHVQAHGSRRPARTPAQAFADVLEEGSWL